MAFAAENREDGETAQIGSKACEHRTDNHLLFVACSILCTSADVNMCFASCLHTQDPTLVFPVGWLMRCCALVLDCSLQERSSYRWFCLEDLDVSGFAIDRMDLVSRHSTQACDASMRGSATRRRAPWRCCATSEASKPPSRVKTRVADKRDAVAMALLQLNAFATHQKGTSWSRGIWMNQFRGELIDSMQKKMKYNPQDRYVAYVAVQDRGQEGEVMLGTVEASRMEKQDVLQQLAEHVEAPSYVYTSSMAVVKEFRRMGVATQLLEAVEEAAVQWNESLICLHVEEENDAAICLYESCGYKVVVQERRWVDYLSSRPNNLLMYKHLEGI